MTGQARNGNRDDNFPLISSAVSAPLFTEPKR
jgi:hypothetical protein